MKTEMTVVITDESWPKLEVIVKRTTLTGETTVETKKILYDQAFLQFETTLQNGLRPMVQEIIEKRKQQRKQRQND